MIEVNKTNFEEEVLKAEGLVMVDFWSPSCEPVRNYCPMYINWPRNMLARPSFVVWIQPETRD